MSPAATKKSETKQAATKKGAANKAAATRARTPQRKKDTSKLTGRLAEDFVALHSLQEARARAEAAAPKAGAKITKARAEAKPAAPIPVAVDGDNSPATLRLRALAERDTPAAASPMGAPVDATKANWTPLGPLAVPNGQTYGGPRILISGRVTAIAPHPTAVNRIYIGTSRAGVWRTNDSGATWTPLGDNLESLAIGTLAIGRSDPNVLYAGTGEGNVQLYSTSYPLGSAPGVYLGVGVLRSADGGANWALHASALLAGRCFYRIVIDPSDANHAFGATSRGLVRTTDGVNWTALAGGGLPAISTSVIACTDVLIDSGDATGNTVYAAFWGTGIYRSTNALSTAPTFTLLTTGLPTGALTSRISLKQSASNPAFKYALIANNTDSLSGVYRTTGTAGTDWELCTSSAPITLYGAFTSDINVDPTTPNVVYVSGVEVYKCVRNTTTGAWTVTNVGGSIHPDNHCFAFHPTLNSTIYAGNDGGFFTSADGGTTWDDSPNEGLCLMQYEAIDNHPLSDAFVQGGTQDNGTQQYRNSPVHHHSADGDGGYCAVSKVNGRNVMHAYYSNSPERSTSGGQFGSYTDVSPGIDGGGLFYPPAAISPTSERLAWATNVVNIDNAMGAGGWPGSGVSLPGIVGRISAVSFSSDSLIYCATTTGQVYRLDLSGGTWTARAIHAAPLPTGQWIWDVMSVPGDDNTILVAFSGFGLASHVWRGAVPSTGTATWTAVSTGLPDVPMYALCLTSDTRWYVGTDIGVYRTTNSGGAWANYSQGLPNTAVYDLRQRSGSNLLRAATHGRGLWEVRTDLAVAPTVDLFVRDHVMDSGRGASGGLANAAWADPTRQVTLNAPCYWWECADIKVDAPPSFQLTPAQQTYFHFETKLVHDNPEMGNQNRVYVQIHNRGPLPANAVTVKMMVAPASGGLPDLPVDFWTTWPNSAGDANWKPVGVPQTIAVLDPLRPEVLVWDWTPPVGSDSHSCMLVVVDSADDPIPAPSKTSLAIAPLVTGEKRVGLKNLHLVNLLPKTILPIPLWFFASAAFDARHAVRLPLFESRAVDLAFLLARDITARYGDKAPDGLVGRKLAAADLALIKKRWIVGEMRGQESWKQFEARYDLGRTFRVGPNAKEVDVPLGIEPGKPSSLVLLIRPGAGRFGQSPPRLTIQQTAGEEVVGGSTFVFAAAKR